MVQSLAPVGEVNHVTFCTILKAATLPIGSWAALPRLACFKRLNKCVISFLANESVIDPRHRRLQAHGHGILDRPTQRLPPDRRARRPATSPCFWGLTLPAATPEAFETSL